MDIALSRHRYAVTLHYSKDQFRGREALIKSLSRQRIKDSTLDYMAAQVDQQVATAPAVRNPVPLPSRYDARWKPGGEAMVSGISGWRCRVLPPVKRHHYVTEHHAGRSPA